MLSCHLVQFMKGRTPAEVIERLYLFLEHKTPVDVYLKSAINMSSAISFDRAYADHHAEMTYDKILAYKNLHHSLGQNIATEKCFEVLILAFLSYTFPNEKGVSLLNQYRENLLYVYQKRYANAEEMENFRGFFYKTAQIIFQIISLKNSSSSEKSSSN